MKQLSSNSFRTCFLLLLASLPCLQMFSQPTVLGTQLVNGGYSTYNLTDRGGFRQVRLQASSGASSGSRNWEFATGTAGSANYSTNWRPYTSGQTLSAYDVKIDPASATASARYNTGFGGQSGLLPAVTSGNYYSVNVGENSSSNNFMSIIETTFNPKTISSVTQSPTSGNVYVGQSVTVTVTVSATLDATERVYVRYTTDNFSSSNFAEATGAGTTLTATLPSQSASTTVTYYVVSTKSSITLTHADVDFQTLELNNNGGSNYSYTVTNYGNLASGGSCNGTWGDSDCWLNGSVPPSGAAITVLESITLNQDATVSSVTVASSKTLTSESGFARTLTVANGGTFTVNGAFTANDGTVAFAGTCTVSGTVTFNHVTLGGGVNFGSSSAIGSTGSLTLNSGGFVQTNPPTYASGSTLTYATGGTYGRSTEWNANNPHHVLITNNTTLNLANASNSSRTMNGNLTINGGTPGSQLSMEAMTGSLSIGGNVIISGTLTLSTGMGGDLSVQGNFTKSGLGTFTHNSRQVSLTGSVDQTIDGTITFAYLDFTKSSGNVLLDDGITVVNRLKNSSGSPSVTSGGSLTFSTAGAQLVNDGSGALDLTGVSVVFSSGATSTISGMNTFNFNNLSLSANSTLSTSATVNGTLTLSSCLFTLGSSTLTLGASANASGTFSAGNMIVADGTGFLRKTFTANGSFTFPIGDNTSTAEYSPVTVNITAAASYSNAYVQANLEDIKHPNNGSTENYVTRYWTVEASGISTPVYSIDLTYVDDDIVATEALMVLGKYSGGTWSTVGTTNALSNTMSGVALTSFSDFTGGSTAFLPVELLDFQARAKNAVVELTWQTASEQNCSHFEIQRSADARTWQKLGEVAGAGFSSSLRSYEFLDEKPLPLNFYRLRQVDFDQKESFSKVISIKFEVGKQPPRISPNPAANELTIEFEEELEAGEQALIFDATGKLVLETEIQPGKTCRLDVSQLASGAYFLKMKGKDWQERFVKN